MKSIFSVLLLISFLSNSYADVCIGTPQSLPKGANCGGGVNCAFGLFCDTTSTCNPYLTPTTSCNSNIPGQCGPTATCKGPTGSQTCVANAVPGAPCSVLSTDSVGYCGGNNAPYQCVNSVCQGGLPGDSCSASNGGCFTNVTCTSGTCVGLSTGQFCTSTYQCAPNNICLNFACTPLITSGSCLQSPSICSWGTYCLYNPYANTTQCVPLASLPQGSFCGYGNSAINAVCQNTLRCINGECAVGRVTACGGGGCSADEYCTCGGESMAYGTGMCQKNVCVDSLTKLATCMTTNCGFNSFSGTSVPTFATSFATTCVFNQCSTQYTAYLTCSSASSFAANIFYATFLAFAISWFSKHF